MMQATRFIPPQLKMRQRNNAEDKLLVKKLVEIESGHRQQNRKLITEIAELHTTLTELDRDGGDHCLDYFDTAEKTVETNLNKIFRDDVDCSAMIKSPFKQQPDSGYLANSNGTMPVNIGIEPRNAKGQSNSCMFGSGVKNMACQHFPCATPRSYNSIGFQITSRPYPIGVTCPSESNSYDMVPIHEERQQNMEIQGDTNIVMTLSQKSSADSERLPRFATRAKVLALKHVLEERKRKLAETKPASWETNYGKPVPLRRLQNPLRPVPTENKHK